MTFTVQHRYRLWDNRDLQLKLSQALGHADSVVHLQAEQCFNVEINTTLQPEADSPKWSHLEQLLSLPTFKQLPLTQQSSLPQANEPQGFLLLEVAPRLNFTTAWSTNAVSIAQSIDLNFVNRIEVSKRYYVGLHARHIDTCEHWEQAVNLLKSQLHDRMTEMLITSPLTSFALSCTPQEPYPVDILTEGRAALERVNEEMGLALDDWDMKYYTELFRDQLKRNPSNVECFDLAQSNSEHSRHWFFKGRMMIDGQEQDNSLFDMIMQTQKSSNKNSVIAFSDNSSAIEGHKGVPCLLPQTPGRPSKMLVAERHRHICLTAETHNFPTGVAPFSGATTGTGGRIRDVQSTGRGAHVIAGTAGYSFGNLCLENYDLPWEDREANYCARFAHPSQVAVEASNGASDYGNKFGEPVLTGFARSFGMRLPTNEEGKLGERLEYIKPIMFSGGIGSMEADHQKKFPPQKGMLVVKVGGPIYRIGVGGGAASSVQVQGDNKDDLDFNAVQRGDAEMEQKMNRVIRACIESLDGNPICSIHDQGAGGNGNVLKEISEPLGAIIEADAFQLGDPTLTILEIWGAEYQESNALLIKKEDKELLETMCIREKCPVSFVGSITGDGLIRLKNLSSHKSSAASWMEYPVNMEIDVVLGKMPRKEFDLTPKPNNVTRPLQLPASLKVMEALQRVLRLPSVASKRYLTNKVDRSVTGLCAQQQCVGPFHTPLADVGVIALSHFDTRGSATAIGEQPVKGILSPAAGARLSVAESLTNLCMASITHLRDVKCSGNWMWPAKLTGEGLALWQACEAMCHFMEQLGVAVDGGKDSLSMAARVDEKDLVVKSPGTLVISTYAACNDIRKLVTPDFKANEESHIVWIEANHVSQYRLGGTALAQVFNQLGDECPDVERAEEFVQAFNAVQALIEQSLLLSAHDISDGGLVTSVLEMAFAGNCGIEVNIDSPNNATLAVLFHEEPGWVVETAARNLDKVVHMLNQHNVSHFVIGKTRRTADVEGNIVHWTVNGVEVIPEIKIGDLRDHWEETSYHLELRQSAAQCAQQERSYLQKARHPSYRVTFPLDREPVVIPKHISPTNPRVAVIREEGSNGDREMIAAFHMAGFDVWDVNTQDLLKGTITLDSFRGVAFVGGFSYADVLGSAKGWSAGLLFHHQTRQQIEAFVRRKDTFSLGVCNGCQLLAWMGIIGEDDSAADAHDAVSIVNRAVYLDHNESGRYESRFPVVRVNPSPSIMLQGMQGSQLGIWVAHGEGRFTYRDPESFKKIQEAGLIALQFIDADNQPTEQYPCNPNGSSAGVAGIVSRDGRHLAMMPHPERCVQLWQWPYLSPDARQWEHSPWLRMFFNAYDWCLN